jgi:hypothetical protein
VANVRDLGHPGCVSEPNKYAMTLDELVATARVPVDDLVEERNAGEHSQHNEAAGHLPGNVRPYEA